MIRFGTFNLNNRLVVYDVTQELVHGHSVWVASLSENPAVRFVAVRPETAVERLRQHLVAASRPAELPWLRPASRPSAPPVAPPVAVRPH